MQTWSGQSQYPQQWSGNPQQPPQQMPQQQMPWSSAPGTQPPQHQQFTQPGAQQPQWGGHQQPQQMSPGSPHPWGPPQPQQQYGGQQWQQPGMCDCLSQPGGCCQNFNNNNVDPYCCGPPLQGQQENTICCDYACWMVALCLVLSVIGLAVVLGQNDRDNIFGTFGVATTRELEAAIVPYVPYLQNVSKLCNNTANFTWTPSCKQSTLFGSFGKYCLEDSLNAGTIAANLSHWNNFRGTMYFGAFIVTLVFSLVVYAVHRQKHPMNALNASNNGQYQTSPPIELFGTTLYEIFRCAWFVCAIIVFFWSANCLTSYWTFMWFYKESTTGPLYNFFVAYDKKFVATVVCIDIFLCWPIFLLAIEIAVWFAFVIPWSLLRCMVKPGLENIRPDMPVEDLPGWVRLDIFFSDAQQIRRLGFSPAWWELVTGSKEPFCPSFDCCQLSGTMPGMPAQQWQHHQQWQQQQQQMQVQPPGQQHMMSTSISQPQSQIPRPGQQSEQPQVTQQPTMNFYPQSQQSESVVVRTAEVEEERKEKKEKKHKEKKEKGTKDKKDKSSTKDKKEKKHKRDKGDDSD